MQFDLLSQSFSARGQKQFCSKSEKDRAKIIILEKDSSSIRPPRCLEGSFCKHAGNVRQKTPQVIFSPMLKVKKDAKKYNLSLSVPVDKYNACFGNPAKTFCNTPQNSAKNREKISIIFFIHQFFHNKFMRALDRSFDKLVGTLEPKVRKTFACYLLSQIFQFFSNVFSSQSLFWTRAVRFWRSCHKTLFAINHENFRLVSGNELFFFHRIFSHEIFPLACKVQFWELSRNFYVEFLESFTELPLVKKQGFAKNFSSWNVPLDTKNAVLTTVQKTSCHIPEIL